MNTIFQNKFENVSLYVRNYKCFGDEGQGFQFIYPINIIIGRNNSGKSALLELIKYVADPYPAFLDVKHKGNEPEVYITQPVTEEALRPVFPENTSGGGIPGNHWEYASKWIGAPITYGLRENVQTFINIEPPFKHAREVEDHQRSLAARIPNLFSTMVFKHLRAERDISQENEQGGLVLQENGGGATNIIQDFINSTARPSELVEVKLLEELNKIYEPDSTFTRIIVQRIYGQGTLWEIYLEEARKGRIPLSHTGSGFKTILLVLILLYLIPHLEDKSLNNYIFAFEELENNLHPALQRRLLKYLSDFVLQNDCYVFLTTHSNVIIDLFSRDNNAQILHVTHDGEKASVTRAQTYIENKGILDDLDVRASDLLQANSVVWVEGPSDRSYINRWIELWTDGELKEGVHYQCMFYGGRLLAHLSAENPESPNQDAVAILRLNNNAAILMDSDRTESGEQVNQTKMRIAGEINGIGGLSWITAGREIENYLPKEAVAQLYEKPELPNIEDFEDFAAYLDKNINAGEGNKFEKAKTQFAANICPILTKENISDILDLSERLDKLCNRIKEWNRIPLQTAQ